MESTWTLAANGAGKLPVGIWIWLGVIGGAVVVLCLIVMMMRKQLAKTTKDHREVLPFTLDELRQMHRAGALSDEEFAKAKQQIIALSTKSFATPTPDNASRAAGPSASGGLSPDKNADESAENDDEQSGPREGEAPDEPKD